MRNTMVKQILSGIFFTVLSFSSVNAQCPNFAEYIDTCDSYDSFEDCTYDPGSTQFWAEAEYLYWQFRDSPEPIPFVTEGPRVRNGAPVLGQPGTKVILGGKDIKDNGHSGGRFALGYWLDECHDFGGEISYLFLLNNSNPKSVFSNGQTGSPFLAIPFINANTNQESSTNLAIAGQFSGKGKLKIENDMQSVELNGLAKLAWDQCYDIYGLAGFRYWNFYETLTFSTNSPSVNPPLDVFKTKDKFKANNQFYGGQIGADVQGYWNCFSLKVQGKIALGAMVKRTSIRGLLETNDYNNFGAVQDFFAGYFALPTNKGSKTNTKFAVIPEVAVKLKYHFNNGLSLQVGYTFLYANEVQWTGNMIDRVINPTQAPAITGTTSTTVVGVRRPKRLFETKSFWAQGLNAGVRYDF